MTKTVGSVTENYSYDSGDKLQSVTSSAGSKNFEYDDAGRTTFEKWNGTVVKSYSYDYEDRMTSTTQGIGTRVYGYNGFGSRVAETGGLGRSWLRSGPGVTASVLKDGVDRFTPGLSARALSGGSSTFFHGGIKSLDSQSGSSQTISATRQYDAFGAVASSSGTWNGGFGYGGGFGYQSDDTGLQQLGNRQYDPSVGRFLSRDPAKSGSNWYSYCENDPVNFADPSGYFSMLSVSLFYHHLHETKVIRLCVDLALDATHKVGHAWVEVKDGWGSKDMYDSMLPEGNRISPPYKEPRFVKELDFSGKDLSWNPAPHSIPYSSPVLGNCVTYARKFWMMNTGEEPAWYDGIFDSSAYDTPSDLLRQFQMKRNEKSE